MTEAEWLTCANPKPMLELLRCKVSDRKLRLWACGFTGWYGSDIPDLREAIEVAEKWADGEPPTDLGPLAQFYVCFQSAWQAAEEGTAGYVANWGESNHKRRATRLLIENLHCIFGNPFHPVEADPNWLTSTVLTLARQMYESRAFHAMPILADALQDAGCENEAILAHCRMPDVGSYSSDVTIPYRAGGPHCRGCWVVDLLLGKE